MRVRLPQPIAHADRRRAPNSVEIDVAVVQLVAGNAEEREPASGLEMDADDAEGARRVEHEELRPGARDAGRGSAVIVVPEHELHRAHRQQPLARVRGREAFVRPEEIDEGGQRRARSRAMKHPDQSNADFYKTRRAPFGIVET